MKFMTLPGHNDLAYEGDHVFNIFVGKVRIFVGTVMGGTPDPWAGALGSLGFGR